MSKVKESIVDGWIMQNPVSLSDKGGELGLSQDKVNIDTILKDFIFDHVHLYLDIEDFKGEYGNSFVHIQYYISKIPLKWNDIEISGEKGKYWKIVYRNKEVEKDIIETCESDILRDFSSMEIGLSDMVEHLKIYYGEYLIMRIEYYE